MSVERWLLSNGLIVLYRRSAAVPLAGGTLLIRAGSCHETAGQAGLANLTMELLFQGSRRRTARQITDEIESIGASLDAQAADDYSEMDLLAPSAQLGPVLDVFTDVLASPSFPPGEIAKEREQVLASLATRHDSIFSFAHDHFSQALYGSHPYGRPVEGTRNSILRLTRKDLRAWHSAHVRPDQAIFSLVASWPASQAFRMIEKYFSRWKRTATSSLSPTLSREGRGGVKRVPSPFSGEGVRERVSNKRILLRAHFEQAYLMTGVLAPAVSDPRCMALKLLNTLLGGGMSSRLFLKLREEMGLAYEVSSFFPTRLQPSEWVVYLGLPKERLAVAAKKLNDMLRDLVRRGVEAAEVRQAKQMIKGSYIMEHQLRRRQAWYGAWWEFLGREPGYDRRFFNEVDRVTPKAIAAVAEELLAQPRVTVEVISK